MKTLIFLGAMSLLVAGMAATKLGTAPHPGAGVKDYKSWLAVTKTPLRMDPRLSVLCAAPAALAGGTNGHAAAFYKVYVNREGTDAMMQGGLFPVGSTIVKEKLKGKPGHLKVDLLTVMTKHPEGYDKDAGNWEFYVTDSAGVRMPAPQGLANCASCHHDLYTSDYVFRTYMPNRR
jgi:hypothetical protein